MTQTLHRELRHASYAPLRSPAPHIAAVPSLAQAMHQPNLPHASVAHLQRTVGNRAVTDMIAQRRAAAPVVQREKDFSDLDAVQYRVSGRPPDRLIEVVERRQGKPGQVEYFVTGVVTGWNEKRPIVTNKAQPVSLGNWYPSVTHINGMAVAPKSGIESVEALIDSVNEAMGSASDAAVDQSAIDVLYTYSARRGGMGADIWDCLKGKVRVDDAATDKQVEIMMDAIQRKKRTTVSAHSRGTIKTDNAVREVFSTLTNRLMGEMPYDPNDALIDQLSLSPEMYALGPVFTREMARRSRAESSAMKVMDQYIQLIYAGNAVSYPSAALRPTLFVGGLDFVSLTVGSYSKLVSDAKSVGKTAGHGFKENYTGAVGGEIAGDIKKRH